MPTYIYKCKDCNHTFEIIGSYTFLSNYKPICPICYKENVVKKIGKPEIIFKGQGFYSNDNKEK